MSSAKPYRIEENHADITSKHLNSRMNSFHRMKLRNRQTNLLSPNDVKVKKGNNSDNNTNNEDPRNKGFEGVPDANFKNNSIFNQKSSSLGGLGILLF